MATKPLCLIPDRGKRAAKGEPFRFMIESVLPRKTDECIFWPYGTNGVGYGYFKIDGVRHYAHRYACEALNGPAPTPKHQALHSCAKGQLGCVNPQHLRWGTPADNMDDRRQHGNHIYGELHGRSKLTASQVSRIRELAGTMTDQKLGDLFNVTGSMIAKIRKGRNWSLATEFHATKGGA